MTVYSIVITQNNLLAGGCNLYYIIKWTIHHITSMIENPWTESNRYLPQALRGLAHYTTWIPSTLRLITPLAYFHEKLSEGLLPATLRLGSDSHPQSVLCELPVREPLPTW